MPTFDHKQEERLFVAYASGTLSPEERDQLADHLEAQPSVKDRLVDFVQDTALFLEVGGELEMLQRSKSTFTVGELLAPQATEKPPKMLFILSAVAATLIAALGVVLYSQHAMETVQVPAAIARIDSVPENAVSPKLTAGNWLRAGPLQIDAGQLDLTLENGVEVSLSGPATANLRSTQRMQLTKGALAAHVPEEATGFTIATAYGSIVDLGTAFIVNANDPERITIHVTEGRVEFWPKNKNLPPQRISAGQAFAATAESLRPIPIPTSTILERTASQSVQHSLRYQHWSFDEAKGDVLSNSGSLSAASFPFTMEKGHRPDRVKGVVGMALSFNGTDDQLVSEHPGITGPNPRTVAFWVKIPPNVASSDSHAIIAWGKPANRNEDGGKWQIAWNSNRNDGTVGAIRTEAGLGYVIGTTDLRDGRWHHVAIVLIGDDNPNISTHVRQYVDGQLEGVSGTQARIVNTASGYEAESHPITLGKYLDNKTGRARMQLDEVYVIEAALVPQEIRELITTNALTKIKK